jgi:hypothetical protein
MQREIDGKYPSRHKRSPSTPEELFEVRRLDEVPQAVHRHYGQVHQLRQPKVPEIPPDPIRGSHDPAAQCSGPRDRRRRLVHPEGGQPPRRPEAGERACAAGKLHGRPRGPSDAGGGHSQVGAGFLSTIPRERGVVDVRVTGEVKRPLGTLGPRGCAQLRPRPFPRGRAITRSATTKGTDLGISHGWSISVFNHGVKGIWWIRVGRMNK